MIVKLERVANSRGDPRFNTMIAKFERAANGREDPKTRERCSREGKLE